MEKYIVEIDGVIVVPMVLEVMADSFCDAEAKAEGVCIERLKEISFPEDVSLNYDAEVQDVTCENTE